jgi:hypothetical protein
MHSGILPNYSLCEGLESDGRNRRGAGRLMVSRDVRCNLGDVIDLSITGMRVLASKATCGVVGLSVIAPGFSVRLKGDVVWSKRLGFRKHMLGVQFLDVDPYASALLTRIASEHRVSRAA